jgi:hypothetical protein
VPENIPFSGTQAARRLFTEKVTIPIQKLAGYGVTPDSPSGILWNFEKFLIGRDGRVVARFLPDVPHDDPKVLAAIEPSWPSPRRSTTAGVRRDIGRPLCSE